MIRTLATASFPLRPLSSKVDFTPLISVVAMLSVVRLVLKVRLTWPVVVAMVFAGTALAWAIQVWGVLYPSAVAFAAAILITAPLHRRDRRWPKQA
jgi:hypothetical protein